jgi:hypothetical protein
MRITVKLSSSASERGRDALRRSSRARRRSPPAALEEDLPAPRSGRIALAVNSEYTRAEQPPGRHSRPIPPVSGGCLLRAQHE